MVWDSSGSVRFGAYNLVCRKYSYTRTLIFLFQRIAFAYLVMALMEIFTKKDQTKDLPPGRLSIFRLYGSQW
jgi:hypothetical protein